MDGEDNARAGPRCPSSVKVPDIVESSSPAEPRNLAALTSMSDFQGFL